MNKNLSKSLGRSLMTSPLFPNFLEDIFSDGFEPAMNSKLSLSEDNEHVYVEADLPGLTKDDIEVSVHKGMLWIKGNKTETEENSQRKYHSKATRSFSYHLTLPESINLTQDPDAKYENGVIHVTFKKLEKEEPKQINIK